MKTKEELGPCQFCGECKSKITQDELQDYYVVCGFCLGSTGRYHSRQDAVDMWNGISSTWYGNYGKSIGNANGICSVSCAECIYKGVCQHY